MPSPVDQQYRAFTQAARNNLGQQVTTDALIDCMTKASTFLEGATRSELVSRIPGKEYFSFEYFDGTKTRLSRGINQALFMDDVAEAVATVAELLHGVKPDDALDLHSALYTAAIALPAVVDITKDNDKKTPGTFFECFVGHLVASEYGVTPTRSVTAPTLDIQISVPTDFVFDLGPGRSRIHLPVKASTRERVIQVWAHQRLLDGMHGVNRFRGLLVVLTETNRKTEDNSIAEVCLPDQWTAYQMYIAQLTRVYYFDLPDRYRALRFTYPFLEVKPFADFFYESAEIAEPSLGVDDPVEQSLGEHVVEH